MNLTVKIDKEKNVVKIGEGTHKFVSKSEYIEGINLLLTVKQMDSYIDLRRRSFRVSESKVKIFKDWLYDKETNMHRLNKRNRRTLL